MQMETTMYLKAKGQASAEEMANAFAAALSADSEVGGQFTVTANTGKLSFVSKETGSTGGSKVLAATTKYDAASTTLTPAQTAGTDAKVEYDFQKWKRTKYSQLMVKNSYLLQQENSLIVM